MRTDDLFREATEVQSFSAGDTIFRTGESADCLYVVKQGQVDIVVGNQVVETAGPGSIIGEMALIDSTARSADAVAKSDCSLLPVDEKRFTFLVQQVPYFALRVLRVMADRLRKMNAES
jgi:CRP/FNR family cyclic AMP-dependent transcriptional regulator